MYTFTSRVRYSETDASGPVSYTHLDVYKRQPHSRRAGEKDGEERGNQGKIGKSRAQSRGGAVQGHGDAHGERLRGGEHGVFVGVSLSRVRVHSENKVKAGEGKTEIFPSVPAF